MAKRGLQLWWRGHSTNTWELTPQVFRAWPRRPARYEANALNRFRQRAPTRHANCPTADDFAAWLFLAQHYGLPTRLLDWTKAPLYALFFAVWEPGRDKVDGTLWGMEPARLNEVFTGEFCIYHDSDPPAKSLVHAAFTLKAPVLNYAVAIEPDERDARMLLQQSRFTIHGDSDSLNSLKHSSTFLDPIVIPARSKPKLRAQLDDLGITRSSLFPDLSNLAIELKDGSWSASPWETESANREQQAQERPTSKQGDT